VTRQSFDDRDGEPRILVGLLVTPSGLSHRWDYRAERDVLGDISLADTQRSGLEVLLDHHPHAPVGRLRYLERQRGGAVWGVASIPAGGLVDYADLTGFYFSIGGGGRLHNRNSDPLLALGPTTDFRLDEVGLVRSTAMVGSQPVRVAHYDYDARSSAGGWPTPWQGWMKDMLDRAMAARRPHLRSSELMILDAPDYVAPLDRVEMAARAAERAFDVFEDEFDQAKSFIDKRGNLVHRRYNTGRVESVGGVPVRHN
jgi:hypothetical protein